MRNQLYRQHRENNGAFTMGKISDKEKENIILKAVEAIQESINQIQVNSRI